MSKRSGRTHGRTGNESVRSGRRLARGKSKDRVDDIRIKLGASVPHQLGSRLGERHRCAVGTSRGDRVEGVTAANDAGDDWDFLAHEPIGIPTAVVAFVARPNNLPHLCEETADLRQKPLAFDRVGR